jgi:DNA-binding transcriptional LysR family regulator
LNDIDLAVDTALEGIGLLYIVEERVAPMVADGRLACLLSDFAPPNSDLFLFYPSRRQNPAALRALIDFMRENVQGAAPKTRLTRAGCPETV